MHTSHRCSSIFTSSRIATTYCHQKWCPWPWWKAQQPLSWATQDAPPFLFFSAISLQPLDAVMHQWSSPLHVWHTGVCFKQTSHRMKEGKMCKELLVFSWSKGEGIPCRCDDEEKPTSVCSQIVPVQAEQWCYLITTERHVNIVFTTRLLSDNKLPSLLMPSLIKGLE